MKKNKKNFFLCICLFMGDMKFFIENQRVEKDVEWVKNQVRLHMNGATTSQMESRGINYRVNYGVAVPHLKQLARRIRVSYELAERLWFLEIRETMLLAAIIVPAEEMTVERCEEWAAKIDNEDLVERTAMFLWPRLTVTNQLMPMWLSAADSYLSAMACYTYGHQLKNAKVTGNVGVDDLMACLKVQSNPLVCRSVSFALRMYMRTSPDSIKEVETYIEDLKNSSERYQLTMAEELRAEIDFLKEA